jgi:catechol 2,3-dioxygenase-like lactoylglutathione lyase family enzyme
MRWPFDWLGVLYYHTTAQRTTIRLKNISEEASVSPSIAQVALLVRDYDEAVDFFARALGFKLLEDRPLEGDKRWVVMAPPGGQGTALLLARAVDPEQLAHVGDQTGGRVFLFLHTDDFWRDYKAMQAHGVRFAEEPRSEPYGTVVVFYDLYGNKWDLMQPLGD